MTDKPFLKTLMGDVQAIPPIWMMRQAGRYLPEYREIRTRVGSFLDLCFNPELAAEVTLQPIWRYGFDAAILFSDILVIPYGLGQPVRFEEGRGPILDPVVRDSEAIDRLDPTTVERRLQPVFETVAHLSGSLPKQTALIGFAGAPWTVATYMVEGGGGKDFASLKRWAYGAPELFDRLIDLLTDATATYLIGQAEQGAEAVQIFDSWAGVLPDSYRDRWSLGPIRRIAKAVKAAAPATLVIAFPKGVGPAYISYAALPEVDAVGLDTVLPAGWAAENLQKNVAVQGNLDPLVLMAGGKAMEEEVRRIRTAFADGPHVFNLGHGVLPDTPPEHVAELCRLVRQPL